MRSSPGELHESVERVRVVRLAPPLGARLLFYTDGLTEVFKGDEEFGPERLMDEFSRCSADKADGILDAIWTAIEAFSEGGPQGDDMSALTLCRVTDATETPE